MAQPHIPAVSNSVKNLNRFILGVIGRPPPDLNNKMSTGNSLAMMPWFPRDYLAATRGLHLAERGAYTDLLFFQWEMGGLPTDLDRLALLIGIQSDEFAKIWPSIKNKFVKRGDQLINKRLEEHRLKAILQRDNKVKGARAAHVVQRAQRGAEDVQTPNPSAKVLHRASTVPPSPSPSPSPDTRIPTPTPPKGGAHRQRRSEFRAAGDRASEAWAEVVAQAGRTDDPLALHAMRAIGGYSRIRLRTTHEESQIRREFIDAYRKGNGHAER